MTALTTEQRKLVEKHHWIVKLWARKFSSTYDYDDLVQEGSLGLMRAAQKFNPKHKVKFASYATLWVRAFMGRMHQYAALVHTGNSDLQIFWLDNAVGGEEDGTTFLEMTPDEKTPHPDDEATSLQLQRDVREALSRLSKKCQGLPMAIVTTRLSRGEGDAATLEILGARYGVSREGVRQVELKTRQLLASYLEPLREAHGL